MRRPFPTALAAAAAACVAAPALAAPTPTGYSPWEWSTPTPTGQALQRVAPVGGSVYAVGDGGTLLRSDDGGATWRGLPTGTDQPLRWVAAAPGGGVSVSGPCDVLRTAEDGALTRLPYARACPAVPYIPPGQSPLMFSLAPDGTNGFLVEQGGTVVTTADAGVTFSRRTSVGQAGDLMVQSATTALVVANGQVQRTTDGGNTWAAVTAVSPLTPLRAIASAGGQDLYAAGTNSMVRSVDGGATWTAVNPGIAGGFAITRLSCSGDACLAVVSAGPQVYRITGAGTFTQTISPSSAPLTDVAFTSPTHAVAVASDGSAVLTDDTGLTWRPAGSALRAGSVETWDIRVRTNDAVATVVSQSRDGVIRTADAGQTWTQVRMPSSGIAADGQFVSSDAGFVLETTGVLYRTTNAGASWQVFPVPLGSTASGMAALSDRRVFVHSAARVTRSDDGGATFRDVAWPRGGKIRELTAAGSALVLRTNDRVLISRNAGRSWSTAWRPGRRGRPTGVSCTGARVCWLTTTRAGVLVTSNGGRTWVDATAAAGAYAGRGRRPVVAAQGTRRAYLTSGTGWAVLTRDGGRTWVPQRVTTGPLRALAAAPAVTYAVDPGGAVLRALPRSTAGTPTRLTLRVRPTARRNRLVLSGRLSRAKGGETLRITSTRGERSSVRVASNGAFTITRAARRSTGFVAQWDGDGARQGAATPVTRVRGR